MKVALRSHRPQWHATWADFEAHLTDLVSEVEADLLVFPEYAGLEAALIGTPQDRSPKGWVQAGAAAEKRYLDLMKHLAAEQGCFVLAGSGPAAHGNGFVNRAWLLGPTGSVAQDKLIPTPYERDEMGLQPGSRVEVVQTPFGRIATLICYDSEFPSLSRLAAAAGADILLVPSCTDGPAGQTRVRQSARARAIEQQCLVLQAPLVGTVDSCDVIDVNTGRAGAFCPPDRGLPGSGILAEGATDEAGWTLVTVDPGAIAAARTTGQVRNFDHWPEQNRRTIEVTQSRLS